MYKYPGKISSLNKIPPSTRRTTELQMENTGKLFLVLVMWQCAMSAGTLNLNTNVKLNNSHDWLCTFKEQCV